MAESIQHTLDALSEFLRTQGLTANGGASEDEIAAFERRYKVQLPADVRAYFARVNGVVGGRDGAWDDEMIALWELRDVRPLNEEVEDCQTPAADHYFVFADWSIWAHSYAIHLPPAGNEAPVFIAFNPQIERVANSFDDFLRGYIRRILGPLRRATGELADFPTSRPTIVAAAKRSIDCDGSAVALCDSLADEL